MTIFSSAQPMRKAVVRLQPWTGSPEQRREYFAMKEAERRRRARELMAAKEARTKAEAAKRAAEVARQNRRRAQAEADDRARQALARALGR